MTAAGPDLEKSQPMESREHNLTEYPASGRRNKESARILLVGGDPECRAELSALFDRRRHRCTHVNRLDEARTAVSQHRYDLIAVDCVLPDGEGLDLAQLIHKTSPSTKTVLLSNNGSFTTALRAIRCGVVDFISTPAEPNEIVERIEKALARTHDERQREKAVSRLQSICKELNIAREEIADQVDVLCSDLVAAYEEMTEQIADASMASEFRTLLRMELDIEELLRTTLEYLLAKTGPTNAAVFLPDTQQLYSLGAYVNYDCPRASIDTLLEHLCGAICTHMSQESEIVSFDDADEFSDWVGIDGQFLADSNVISFSCTHEGECMAVVVLFRSKDRPFEPRLAGTLDILRSIFAEQLSRIIRIHYRAKPQWPDEAADDEMDFDDGFDSGFDSGYGGGLAA